MVHHILGYQHARILGDFRHFAHVVEFAGPLGVKIFFVISGFVICRLLIVEEERTGTVSLRGFYLRRVFRILPAFYVYLCVISVLLTLNLIDASAGAILMSGLFVHDFRLGFQDSWFVGHTWSLAVEEQFYLLFPAFWVLTPKVLRFRFFLALTGLIAAWNTAAAWGGWNGVMYPSARAGFVCISAGILLAICEARARRAVRRLPAILPAAAAVLLVWHPVGAHGVLSTLYEVLAVPPAIVLLLTFSLERGPALRAFLVSKPVQAVGLSSYGIYLWQQLFTAPLQTFASGGRLISMLLPALFVVVPASYFLIEKPAIRLGRMLSSPPADGPPVAELA